MARRRTAAAIPILLALAWLLLGGHVLLREDAAVGADAVFVLCCDNVGDARTARGLEVLRSTGAERLVLLNDPTGTYDPSAVATIYLRRQNAPMERTRVVGPVESTLDEARAGAALARRCGWDEVVVVTSPYHARRAGWLFERALPGAEVSVVPTNEPVRPSMWWSSGAETKAVLSEVGKIVASARYLFSRPAPLDVSAAC